VQRKIPGRDGSVLQVRPDPGTDVALVEAIAEQVAAKLVNPAE
jgi:DNA mismatch repair protein MutH